MARKNEKSKKSSSYKSLIKLNQECKRLSDSSKYIICDGMVLSYQVINDSFEDDFDKARGVIIMIIDNKRYDALDEFKQYPLQINGDKLYQYNKNYEFEEIIDSDNDIILRYSNLEDDMDDYYKRISEYFESISLIFNQEELITLDNGDISVDVSVDRGIQKAKAINKFMSTNEINKISVIYDLSLKKIDLCNNKISVKSLDIINMISNSEVVGKYNLTSEEIIESINGSRPIRINIDLTNGLLYTTDLMKSVMINISNKTECISILVLHDTTTDFYYLNIRAIRDGNITCSIYKTFIV